MEGSAKLCAIKAFKKIITSTRIAPVFFYLYFHFSVASLGIGSARRGHAFSLVNLTGSPLPLNRRPGDTQSASSMALENRIPTAPDDQIVAPFCLTPCPPRFCQPNIRHSQLLRKRRRLLRRRAGCCWCNFIATHLDVVCDKWS